VLVIGYSVLVIGYSVLVIGYSVLVIGYSVLVIGYSVLVIGYSVLVIGYSILSLIAMGLARLWRAVLCRRRAAPHDGVRYPAARCRTSLTLSNWLYHPPNTNSQSLIGTRLLFNHLVQYFSEIYGFFNFFRLFFE
jgi:hypothetical protein